MKNKPITVLFDVSPLANSKKSGVGYYTERLLVALATKYPNDIQIIGHYFNFLGKKQITLPQLPNITYHCTKLFPSKAINILRRLGIEIPQELFVQDKVDLILYPNFVGFPSLRQVPSAVVVHDLGYIDCPEYIQPGNRSFLQRYVPVSIARSQFVIAVSEATKQAVIKHYKTDPASFVITHIPPAPSTAAPEPLPAVDGKFISFISTLEPRKNFIGLVRGYMKLPEDIRKKYSLVLAGGTGWDVEQDLVEIKQLQEQGEKIILTGYITEGQRAWLLAKTSLFVMPSHYEGFGMPILEAMQSGAPTAVSDIAVFREVSGDASIYFDQNSPESVAAAIQSVLVDPKLQQELKNRGQQQTSRLNWDEIAERVYARILASVKPS